MSNTLFPRNMYTSVYYFFNVTYPKIVYAEVYIYWFPIVYSLRDPIPKVSNQHFNKIE